ncbi:MAG: RICIN domain-containing protein [Treponema sp.]|jgi:hypothetical protein|nr:RICIN domain-containing protein [Treponema sp.]
MKKTFIFMMMFLAAAVGFAQGYYIGDGGKGITLAVLEPTGKGLADSDRWILPLVQGVFNTTFNRYSAISIVDRQNLDKILAEQTQSTSGNYSDADYISIGKLTNARHILIGTITKTPNGSFMLEFSVSDAEAGKRLVSYGPTSCAPAALENLSAINTAAADLLGQLGVQLTDKGKHDLTAATDTRQVQAETALSKGIAAQKSGTVVEALAYYFQAVDYDPTFAEAESRLSVVNTDLASENLGANVRSEIQWRKQWIERLTECEQFFTKYLRDPTPYNLVYSAELQPGEIDWNKETLDIGFELGFYADDKYFEILQNVVNAVKSGLDETGRVERWKLNWPSESISQTTPFVGKSGNVNLTVELLNASRRVIGRVAVTLPYGYSVNPRDKTFAVRPLGGEWQSLSFQGVDANVATDPLSLRVASIDGVTAAPAAQTRRISIAAEANMGDLRKRVAASAPTITGVVTQGYWHIQSANAPAGSPLGYWDISGSYPAGSSMRNGQQLLLYRYDRMTDMDRLYRFADASDGWFNIIAQDGHYVDIDGNNNGNGVKVQLWDRNGTGAQKFKLVKVSAGLYKIMTTHGRFFATQNFNANDGNGIHTWEDYPANEIWRLVEPNTGRVYDQ